jgi:hypothetical protein
MQTHVQNLFKKSLLISWTDSQLEHNIFKAVFTAKTAMKYVRTSTSNISVFTGLKSHFYYTGLVCTHSERQSHRTFFIGIHYSIKYVRSF